MEPLSWNTGIPEKEGFYLVWDGSYLDFCLLEYDRDVLIYRHPRSEVELGEVSEWSVNDLWSGPISLPNSS